jgi:hypothetical protein
MNNLLIPAEILETEPSLNPNSDRFDFDLWASAVREQMLAVLQKRLGSNQRACQETTTSVPLTIKDENQTFDF